MKNVTKDSAEVIKPSPNALRLEYSIAVHGRGKTPVNFTGSSEIAMGLLPAHLIEAQEGFDLLFELVIKRPTMTEVNRFFRQLLEEAHRSPAERRRNGAIYQKDTDCTNN